MTNKEKIDRILNYVDAYTSEAILQVNKNDASSAKWIYTKGQSDAAKKIYDVISDIVNS